MGYRAWGEISLLGHLTRYTGCYLENLAGTVKRMLFACKKRQLHIMHMTMIIDYARTQECYSVTDEIYMVLIKSFSRIFITEQTGHKWWYSPLLSKAHNFKIQLMGGWMKGEGSFHSILLNQCHWDQSIFQVQVIRNFDILLFNSSNCCQILHTIYIFGNIYLVSYILVPCMYGWWY